MDPQSYIHRENKGLERWLSGQVLTCEQAQNSYSSGLYADARQCLSAVQISSKLITQQPVDSWASKHTWLSNEHLKRTTTQPASPPETPNDDSTFFQFLQEAQHLMF